MERIKAIETIVNQLDDELVICNIGFPSRELYSVKDSPNHFYMLGSMGMASSIGLGLAMSQDRKVIAFDGDGSVLMNLGSLVTIYNQAPENLVLVVIDNECYGSTGSQCTYASTVNLGNVAESIGFKNSFKFSESDEINFKTVLESEGPVFVHLKVKAGNADVPIIDMTPEEIIGRFMEEIKKNK
jgi:sulfopyruvate decarboxylase subunit beta